MTFVVFFFFKQKTAYEMRISDWSSDVCSSDLLKPPLPNIFSYENKLLHSCRATAPKANEAHDPSRAPDQHSQFSGVPHRAAKRGIIAICHDRSEEHTSELQSLMRISYAVFCLKTKITTIRTQNTYESQDTNK